MSIQLEVEKKPIFWTTDKTIRNQNPQKTFKHLDNKKKNSGL